MLHRLRQVPGPRDLLLQAAALRGARAVVNSIAQSEGGTCGARPTHIPGRVVALGVGDKIRAAGSPSRRRPPERAARRTFIRPALALLLGRTRVDACGRSGSSASRTRVSRARPRARTEPALRAYQATFSIFLID